MELSLCDRLGYSFNGSIRKNVISSLMLAFVLLTAFGLGIGIQRVEAQPVVYYIRADGSIEPSTPPILTFDNTTYTLTDNITGSVIVERSNIIINGSGYALQGYGGLYNENGFTLFEVDNVTIKDTTIENFAWGIHLNSTTRIVLSGNHITHNQQDGIGSFASSNNIILSNDISNNTLCGINLQGSWNNSIIGNNMTFNGPGIWLNDSSNNTVAGNYIDYNRWRAILVDGSSNNSIVGNNLTRGEYGILLQNSSSNSMVGNNITGNAYGIRVHSFSNGNTVVGNNLEQNVMYGIFLFYASNNIVSDNNITDNGLHGVRLDGSSGNSIVRNNVTDNPYGIYVLSSSGNLFYYNNPLNNTVQTYVTSDSANTWDNGYPSGGNYWSDYAGADVKSDPYQNETGSDGIGDTPYKLDSNNTDRYPLMTPYVALNDIGAARITPSKTVVGEGYSMNITIKILNYGVNIVTFNLTAYANTTTIITFTNMTLTGRTSATIMFTWNTSGFPEGSYTISAYVTPVAGEIYTSDNNLTGGIVMISVPCDVTGPVQGIPDGQTDMHDINYIAGKFGTTPLSANWDSNADVTGPTQGLPDNKVNMRDIGEACSNFGAIGT